MQFEWDDNKNQINLGKHGISFEEAAAIWENPLFTAPDNRFDYKEKREISIGEIKGVAVIVAAHTQRGNNIRIISARKANNREKRKYYEYLRKAEGRDQSHPR